MGKNLVVLGVDARNKTYLKTQFVAFYGPLPGNGCFMFAYLAIVF
jgi:hypothetical protein